MTAPPFAPPRAVPATDAVPNAAAATNPTGLAPEGGHHPLHLPRDRAARAAEVIRALGHPVRLCIAARLCRGRAYVGQLARELECTPAVISQQLRILRLHRLVAVARSDGRAYYELADPALLDFIGCVAGLCPKRRPAESAPIA